MILKDKRGPAFPQPSRYCGDLSDTCGMTLRDWFAGQIASVLITKSSVEELSAGPDIIAGAAYEYADAMLAARIGGDDKTAELPR